MAFKLPLAEANIWSDVVGNIPGENLLGCGYRKEAVLGLNVGQV